MKESYSLHCSRTGLLRLNKITQNLKQFSSVVALATFQVWSVLLCWTAEMEVCLLSQKVVFSSITLLEAGSGKAVSGTCET